MDLFSVNEQKVAPLADRMRPQTLDEFLGQKHIVGKGTLLRRAIEADRLTSCIFFGPPGVGKTTLASIIAHTTSSAFEQLNAVTSGVGDVRKVIDQARDRMKLYGQSTYLLLDECHRWSKSQSDSILPAIERGVIRFIGSTTENPVIAMTPAIVSRCRLFQFRPLDESDVESALRHALADKARGFGNLNVQITDEALRHIAVTANGDVRNALNGLELAVLSTPPDAQGVIIVDLHVAEQSIQQKVLAMDESYYYDMLSAFCKSLRGSDSDAALAWFARMVTSGVETVVLLSHKKADSYIHIDVEFGEGEGKIPVDSIAKRAEAYKPKEKVTYKMIKEYIEAKYGFKVHTAYIAEVKRNLGLPMYDAPNAVEELKQPRKHPTPEKVEAIKDALRYFAVI